MIIVIDNSCLFGPVARAWGGGGEMAAAWSPAPAQQVQWRWESAGVGGGVVRGRVWRGWVVHSRPGPSPGLPGYAPGILDSGSELGAGGRAHLD